MVAPTIDYFDTQKDRRSGPCKMSGKDLYYTCDQLMSSQQSIRLML